MPPKKAPAKGKDAKKDPKKASKAGGGGGKAKKKKWSKGKVREKLNNLVLWDKPTLDKLYSEVPKYKVITTAVVSDRLRVNGSLARAALKTLLSEGLIRCVSVGSNCTVYTRKISADAKSGDKKGKKDDKADEAQEA
eukprot:NODE_959_length_644_cov_775.485714_g887_i0.p1 GENE.NODE_959_length_644_cov_775.485714_g887_i0~~NODE_959_length_644_cov_775.485714_g887_i0.p1  ORF type:complete len:137 (+),score=41.77 NODE_959_length_644_cov_775.485714_g887_i0:108-518(+)